MNMFKCNSNLIEISNQLLHSETINFKEAKKYCFEEYYLKYAIILNIILAM